PALRGLDAVSAVGACVIERQRIVLAHLNGTRANAIQLVEKVLDLTYHGVCRTDLLCTLQYIRAMNRMPASPLISKGLEIARNHLGIEELAKRLHTVPSVVHAWHMGHSTMPEFKFLRLVDILNELEPDWTDKAAP